MSDSVRSFVSVPLSAETREAVGRVIGELKGAIPELPMKWVRPENLHLTLRFLGQVPVENLQQVAVNLVPVASETRSFELALGDLGCFPERGAPTVLWLGLGGDLSILAQLQGSVEQAVCSLAAYVQRTKFHPHVTLARIGPLSIEQGKLIRSLQAELDSKWRVEAIELVGSFPGTSGPRYEAISRFDLGI